MTARALLVAALVATAGCGGGDDCAAGAPNVAVGWYGLKGVFNDFATSAVPLISPPQGGGAGVLAAVRAQGVAAATYHFVIDVAVDGLAVMSTGGDVDARLTCKSPYAVSQNLPILLPGTAFSDLRGRTAHVDIDIGSPTGMHMHATASNVIAEPDGP